MESLELLLNRRLLFFCVAILTIGETSKNFIRLIKYRLPSIIIPLHYDISLELYDTDRNQSGGECKIYIQIKHPMRNISFHADQSQIRNLSIYSLTSMNNTELMAGSKDLNYLLFHHVDHKKNHIVGAVFLNAKISAGFYIMHLKFNIEYSNKGSLFRTSYIYGAGERTWLVATDFETIGARKLFPCLDEPAFRATFNISIKHHSKYHVLSNMPMQMIRDTEEPNMEWTDFEKTPLIPTYQVSVILLPDLYSNIYMGDTVIQYRNQFQYRNSDYVTFAFNIIDKLTTYFTLEWKCFKVSHVAIPGFPHNAVTNLGLIYYREAAIIYDQKKDSPMRQIEIARLIGRTVAYQCFYNTLPSWWSYMWLNEGIAMLLGVGAIEEAFSDLRMKDLFVVQIQQESLRLDTGFIMKPLISEVKDPSDIDSIFSMSYYIKAPVIIRMLKEILTNNVFRDGLKMYLSKEFSSFETRTLDVFCAAMQTAYNVNRKFNQERLNITQIMDAWTKQQHYPVIKVTRDKYFVKVLRQSMNTSEKNWWIPYTVANQMNPDFSLSDRSQLKMQNFLAEIDDLLNSYDFVDEWIIVNIQQIGYYRVNYDTKSWQKIVNYLNSDNYAKIHVINRAQIIDDAFYFLMEGQLDLSIFVELTGYLSQVKDYVAWYPMIKAFEYMSCFFPFIQSNNIKHSMREILDTLLKKIGYETKSDPSDIIESLRQEASKWACTLGSSECKKEANFKLKQDLMQKSPVAWLNEWKFCNGLMIADIITWDKVFNIYTEKSDYTILKCLACSEHFSIIRYYTRDVIAYNKKIKDNDRINIFHSVVARHAKNDTVLDYILANFDIVKPRIISTTTALIDIINNVYSEQQLDKISEFLENYFKIKMASLCQHPFIDKLHNKTSEFLENYFKRDPTCPFKLHPDPLFDNKIFNKVLAAKLGNDNIPDSFFISQLSFLEMFREMMYETVILSGRITLIKDRLKMRLSQIALQIHHFQNFY